MEIIMRRVTQTALAVAAVVAAAAPAHAASGPFAIFEQLFGGGQQTYQQQLPAATSAYAALPQQDDVYAPARQVRSTTRETVTYSGSHAPGTVVISTTERRLYYVLPGGKAIRYAVGVGREGFQWSGTETISNKQEWPDWRPPQEMLRRRPDLPRYMAGGEHNPLGARAMYLGASLYRIHGSNEPETIGHAVSSGCIRMLNSDVMDLYQRVQVGTTVVVMR
jgi:lipoprotein-anchoring transpeptidase ErfK/SrfK